MSSSNSNNNNSPPGATAEFQVNLSMLPRPLDFGGLPFPSRVYYNTWISQSPSDFHHFRQTRIYPLFNTRHLQAISQVEPRPQRSYVHSIVSAVIAQFPAHHRELYNVLARGNDWLLQPLRIPEEVYSTYGPLFHGNICGEISGLHRDQRFDAWLNLMSMTGRVLSSEALDFAVVLFHRGTSLKTSC